MEIESFWADWRDLNFRDTWLYEIWVQLNFYSLWFGKFGSNLLKLVNLESETGVVVDLFTTGAALGYCKNGTSCRFLHGGGLGDLGSDGAQLVGSPSKLDMMDQSCHEALLRSKTPQQQRLAAASQLMASANSFPYSSKCMNFLLQQQQIDAQSRSPRLERNEFPMMNGGAGMMNPASRQIYLTLPADSTLREEDVSNYFSIYGPVQDVRIPYQQKRMFGFVTFVYSDTVKLILAKGNPHFVCDASAGQALQGEGQRFNKGKEEICRPVAHFVQYPDLTYD
ncbi:hypothetical protein ACLB2K_045303 [Fragaria x ananassa]